MLNQGAVIAIGAKTVTLIRFINGELGIKKALNDFNIVYLPRFRRK